MDAYGLHEGRHIQEGYAVSAADATDLFWGPVPAGFIRTIIGAAYFPSATETRVVQFMIRRSSASDFPFRDPVSIALGAAVYYPALTEGMELKLYPGEYLRVVRAAATAGSTMSIRVRYIETELPFYSYEEPLKKVVQAARRHGTSFARGVVTPASVPPSGGPGSIDHGGGGGTGEPV